MTTPKEATWQEFLQLFDESLHDKIRAACRDKQATHIVCFECLQLDSSWAGRRAALVVGPSCAYRTVEETHGKWLNDLPSQRQYPVYWATVPEEVRRG